MSVSVSKDEYADRRRHMRRSVYRTAELMLRGSAGHGVDCTVLDESEGGVQVELSQALDLPEELMIKFSDMASQLVRRCWAKGTRAGYQYIEIVPAQRRWTDEVPPPGEVAPDRASFVAFNDFIHISRPLLDLAGEPVEWLYPAELIHGLISGAAPALNKPLLTAPAQDERVLVFFGPRWISRV
jgi:hypothetical protein